MSLFSTQSRPKLLTLDVAALVRRLWTVHRDRRAARASLERLLDRTNDHLLDDVGLDRETAHRLLGETLVLPHRGWDRWQLSSCAGLSVRTPL